MHNALILNYRHFATEIPTEMTPYAQAFAVSQETFAEQMALLNKLRIKVVSLEELIENTYKRKRWHRHVVAITCNDTFLTSNNNVLPLLEHLGFPATVFITTQDQTHAECWSQWRQIAAIGISLGSHTVSHPNLTKLPEAELREELLNSKKTIEAETGQPVRFLAAPYGLYDKRVMRVAREVGYEALLTKKVGVNRFDADLFQLKRWTVPANCGLKEFERMLCRDKKELVAQKVKARALLAGKVLLKKSPLARLKRLLAKVKVRVRV